MDYKAAFIHTPKCAGTTVRELIKKNYDEHIAYIPDNRSERWARYLNLNLEKDWYFHTTSMSDFPFLFTFVRNPFSRLVSFWFYGKSRNRAWLPWEMSFYKFVKLLSKQTFDQTRDDFFAWSHVRPYTHKDSVIFNNGVPAVDFIGKVENYKTDLNSIFDKLKLPLPTEEERVRTTEHLHYSRYYNNESIAIASDFYGEDLQYFDYQYESRD